MRYVPRHLPNKLEYKVLSCISVHYQSRMTSNEIASTPSHPPTVQAGQYGESFYTSRSYPGTVLGDTWGCCAGGVVLLVGDNTGLDTHAHAEQDRAF